ncbi:unnamed protein product [Somion occarium]|uniref:beta-N-acetylhexosaminidase n=1 Tax=Somion occarium TaxID=3059160 RepID=A0ABP1CJI0_9APHY
MGNISRLTGWLILIVAILPASSSSAFLPQIPTFAAFTPGKGAAFPLSPNVRVLVDAHNGLIGSPTAFDFAETFRQDLISVTAYTHIPPVQVAPHAEGTKSNPVIFITINPKLNFTLFNGKTTNEGYQIDIVQHTVTISATAPIGAWWGTRTLVQQAAVANDSKQITFPSGRIVDSPGWEVRGFMLDAGRHWFDTSFLSELCTYASFFKINELHLHASDNLWNPAFLYGDGNEGWKNLYAAFRFRPPGGSALSSLVPRKNESWTQTDFLALQTNCARRGVTIVPEIDTPGHSLVINQWKPQLMENGQPDHLNLSFPETIPTIRSIWDEFLPWFQSSEVSIGADEYDASLANDYISFVNGMSDYIQAKSGKSIRIWGTNEPSRMLSVSKNITIQHWNFPGDDIPVRLMESGYEVINSEQTFLYLDGKTSEGGQFPQELSQDLIWNGAPGGKGWAPNIFSASDPSNNTNVANPKLRGSIMALWNDWGNNATTKLEIYYQLSRSLAVFAEKTWAGSEVRETGLTRDQFDAVYPILNAAAPGQNLNRVVAPTQGNIIYSFPAPHLPSTTSVSSVGPPYTLTFSVTPSSHSPDEGVLFAGLDSTLHVSNLTFEATGQLYSLGYTLPQHKYTTIAIHATREYTYAIIDGNTEDRRYWTTLMDIWGDFMALGNMSFAAPAQKIGANGFMGDIKDVVLRLGD